MDVNNLENVASFEELTIPHELNVNEVEDAPKNILLLSLSTFGKMVKNEFKLEGTDKKYSGIYQLDPIPKMLSDFLGEKGHYLDEIIMLETELTTKIVEPREIDFYGKEVTIDCSPEQFFKCQVKNYLRPLPAGFDDGIDSDKRFKSIVIKDTDNPSMEIKEAVEYIRQQFEENDNNVKLYIDAHGAFRGLSLAILAINSLLLNENKGAEKVYSIKTDANIIFEDRADKLFQFVSGLNEFRSFGRIDSLESYMDGLASGLTGPMKNLADAISVCNIPRFESSIQEIKKFFDSNEGAYTESSSDRENYLAIFSNVIKEDYQNLLKDNSTVVDEIEWCFNKRLYQAALTIVESKVAEYIFGKENNNADLPLIEFADKAALVEMWESDPNFGKSKKTPFATWLLNKVRCNGRGKRALDANYKTELRNHSHELYFDVGAGDAVSINERFISVDVKRFIYLLKMLKQTRNEINHCSNNIPSTDIICEALEEFLETFRTLEELSFDVFVVTEINDKGQAFGHLENESQTVRLTTKSVQKNKVEKGEKFKVRWKAFNEPSNMNLYEIV